MQAETVFAETDCIETGIVELVSLYGIIKLVIGAAADRSYSKYEPHRSIMRLFGYFLKHISTFIS